MAKDVKPIPVNLPEGPGAPQSNKTFNPKIWELYALGPSGEITQALGTADSLEQAKRAIESKWAPQFDPSQTEPGTWSKVAGDPAHGEVYAWPNGTNAFLVEQNGSDDPRF